MRVHCHVAWGHMTTLGAQKGGLEWKTVCHIHSANKQFFEIGKV